MKTFLGSTVTKAILLALLGQLAVDLLPMVREHAIDLWKLVEGQLVLVLILLGNALRSDVNVPGLNWFGPKVPKQ